MGLAVPLLRRGPVLRRVYVGVTYSVTPGAFSWTAPAGVDDVDIVVVGNGGTGGTSPAQSGGSGAVAMKTGRKVSVGQVIPGIVTAANSGQSTICDGMSCPGANTYVGGQMATGGDYNWAGVNGTWGTAANGASIPTLTGLIPAAGAVPDPCLHPTYTGKGGVLGSTALLNGTAPGGGGGCWGSAGNGAPGGIFIYMYRFMPVGGSLVTVQQGMTSRTPPNLLCGLQRRSSAARRFVGLNYLTTVGAVNHVVPYGVDEEDLIAIGGGAAAYGAGLTGAGGSGAIAIRHGKQVYAGKVIIGTVGAGGVYNATFSSTNYGSGGTTTIDGLSAPGGTADFTTTMATGGELNYPSNKGTPGDNQSGSSIYSWALDAMYVGNSNPGPYLDPVYNGQATLAATAATMGSLFGSGGAYKYYVGNTNGTQGGIVVLMHSYS